MLNYGLPAIPPSISGEDTCRWYIKQKSYSPEYRYLHLEKFVPGKWWGRPGRWVKVHETMISDYKTREYGFEKATFAAAEDIIREITVNFKLPTGEVR